MAASTCEGWTLPEEQAAPEDTATPSRSKAMTAVSAFMPGTANSVVLGSRSASAPKIDDLGRSGLEARLEAVAQRRHARGLRRESRAGGRRGRAEAGDPRHVLGPGARRRAPARRR